MSNLIGQVQVHYFTNEPPWSTYEPGIMWSNLIGQFEVHNLTFQLFTEGKMFVSSEGSSRDISSSAATIVGTHFATSLWSDKASLTRFS